MGLGTATRRRGEWLCVLLTSGFLAATVTAFGGTAAVAASCTVNDVGTTVGGISNSSAIDCINIQNSTVNSNVTNTVGGTIDASGTAAGTAAITINNSTVAGSVSNAGTIIAGSGGGIVVTNSGLVSVFDSGTIVGNGHPAVDISGSAVGSSFTLGPGYNITGLVLGQFGDTFQLGGTGSGTFNLSLLSDVVAGGCGGGICPQYLGFSVLNVVSGTWTTTGTYQGGPEDWNVLGGTLAGTGTFNGVNVASGGTLEPGLIGTPGTFMTLNGNLAFQSGAIYLVNLNAATASRVNVAGTASLAGTVSATVAGGVSHQAYDILHAGSINGTFDGFSADNLSGTLTYTPTDVFLNLAANLGAGTALNINQRNVATSISNFFNTGGALPPAFLSLFGLTGANLANALTQASGELGTGSQQTTFDAMGQFMGLLTDPFMNRVGGANPTPGASGYADEALGHAGSKRDAYAMFTKAPPVPFVQRWSVWAAGYGGSRSTSGNAIVGSNDTTSNIYGTAVGADYLFSPNTIAGFALAGGGTNFSVANGGSGRSDLFQAGAYVRHTEGAAYISAALAYGWQDITTNRTVTAAGIDQLRAEFNANAYSGRVEGGYRFVAPWVGGIGITPYAAGQFTTFDLPAYAESVVSGSPAFAQAYGAKDVTDVRSELGLRTDKSFAMSNGILTLRSRFAWAHDFDPDRSIAATFQALPGASFVVNGAAQASDSALATASIEMKWMNGWSAAATFEGEFSNVTESYAGKGVVRYAW